jgi:hypothetical protein
LIPTLPLRGRHKVDTYPLYYYPTTFYKDTIIVLGQVDTDLPQMKNITSISFGVNQVYNA